MNINKNSIPWVEKYRPVQFNDIILDSTNKQIFNNIINFKRFPNLLFYGPPGTGKTTTIINLIKEYQNKYSFISDDQILHLNASDDRGIEIIRNQIYSFVKSIGLFNNSIKFVILDEIDYMTKNAQLALRYLIKEKYNNVRYILICNYISRIDETLQNDFVRIRFNQLPINDIIKHIENICINEKLNINRNTIYSIQKLFNSDIRSMVNYLQSNYINFINNNDNENNDNNSFYILTDDVFINLIQNAKKEKMYNDYLQENIKEYIKTLNINSKTFIKLFLNYLFKHHKLLINKDSIKLLELINYTEGTYNNECELKILKNILSNYLV